MTFQKNRNKMTIKKHFMTTNKKFSDMIIKNIIYFIIYFFGENLISTKFINNKKKSII
jgi:hypothetical protein